MLEGLDERDYTLNVADPKLHWGTQVGPVTAGTTDLEIVTPAELVMPRVRGRILSMDGQPVPDVAITSWLSAFHEVEDFSGGTSDVMRFFLGEAVRTDADGRFELEDVPRAFVQFHAISDDIVPSYFSVEDITDPDRFEVRVLARAHLEIQDRSGAENFHVVDAEGQRVTLLLMRADGYSNFEEMPLVQGRSGVVTVTTDAAELVLTDAEGVVDRIPLSLRPGEVATIEN